MSPIRQLSGKKRNFRWALADEVILKLVVEPATLNEWRGNLRVVEGKRKGGKCGKSLRQEKPLPAKQDVLFVTECPD